MLKIHSFFVHLEVTSLFGNPPSPHVTLGHLLANPPPPMEVTSFVDGPPGSQVPGPRIRVPKIKMVKNEVVPWQETQDPISIPKVDA